VDFSLTQEHRLLREQVRDFSKRELEPVVAEADATETLPMDVYRRAGELGFLGSYLPAPYGGGGGDLLGRAIIKEEFARVSPGFSVSAFDSSVVFANNVWKLGSEGQRKRYLPPIIKGEKVGCWCLTEPNAGSDALSIETSAARQGERYVINGTKTLITNAPIADFFIVLARTSPREGLKGGTAFILEREMRGLSTAKAMKKLGMRCSPTGELFLQDVSVPREQILGKVDEGFAGMLASLDVERALAPMTGVGIAQACLEHSLSHVRKRLQSRRPIIEFQLIQAKLADMAVGIELSRAYAHRVIAMAESGEPISKEAAIAKYYSSSIAVQSALEAVQIMGERGYLEANPVERYLRDAKMLEIGGGTSEIQKLIIAREELRQR
jgi:alkylation response protein AidB-like acyl-CoA dehydrogenase